MTRILLPHPPLTLLLTLMWLLLTRFSLGQLILGFAVALLAGRAMASLQPEPVRLRRPGRIPRLVAIMVWDILRSNIAVAGAIVSGRPRRPGFVEIPLDLRSRSALALLAIVVTATPGTAWIEYRAKTGVLLIHAFDEEEEGHWLRLIKTRYEALLQEIFE